MTDRDKFADLRSELAAVIARLSGRDAYSDGLIDDIEQFIGHAENAARNGNPIGLRAILAAIDGDMADLRDCIRLPDSLYSEHGDYLRDGTPSGTALQAQDFTEDDR